MKIRKQIKHRRQGMGLAQWQVAKRIGVTRSAYSNWENGHRTLATARLRQIERVLHRRFA